VAGQNRKFTVIGDGCDLLNRVVVHDPLRSDYLEIDCIGHDVPFLAGLKLTAN
jgi:hypothetical protein